MIIVVDDERKFDPEKFNTDWFVQCWNSDQACRLLGDIAMDGIDTIDELWLDHDLGGDDTIRPFVLMIEEMFHEGHLPPIGKIMIHTSNPAGRKWMMQGLDRILAGVVVADPNPFLIGA